MQNTHSLQGLSFARRTSLRVAVGMIVAIGIVGSPRTAHAQIDPLAIIKRSLQTMVTSPSFKTHLLVAMDTSLRMQFDAAGNYYDPYDYTTGNVYDTTLGINSSATKYRRLYTALQFTSSGSPKFETSTISVVGNNTASATAYANFYAKTRLAVAKAALIQAVGENVKSARFGFVGMRQGSTPSIAQLNDGNVLDDDVAQAAPTDTGLPSQWYLTRGKVTADNGTAVAPSPVAKVQADSSTANTAIVTLLNKSFTTSGAILPAGNDGSGRVDAPLSNLLTDLKTEATRLITGDTSCRNTIAVLITGGGEGNSATPGTAASAVATGFKTISSRRVPIYVIALAPPASAVTELQAIAANSGGQYFEVSQAEIDAAVAAGVPVPKVVRAIDLAVQHGMANPSDVNMAPTASLPYGPQSEFLVTSPVVGTVDLTNAKALDGSTLPDTDITSTKSGADVPQRANVMVTTGFAVPGFDMKMRSYRLYKPAIDATKPTGYKFVNDGTPLWVAQTPMTGYCNDATASCRNIFTTLPNGTTIPFTDANASTLSPYLNTWDAAGLINYVRTQPLGAVISSTPAFMDPPSLDPPPDSDYPAFAVDHEDRRTLIFIGSNDGMMHAIDGRTGIEVWAFIPFNLLPKLRTLRDGQGIDSYAYFVDTSAKVADVKIGGAWRTMVTYGEGIGGTFYQAFDASLDDMGSSVSPDSDSVATLLSYFNNVDRIKYLWAFPRYSQFDTTINTTAMPYGDLANSASADEKSVGQTWSDPAVGQIKDTTGPYTIIVGSGFLPRSVENGSTRGGATAGQKLYLLSAEDGHVYASSSVGNDGLGETDDDCTAMTYGCTKFKNAIQADPVATGPSDSRFVTKSYVGDLDGKVWRFDLDLDSSKNPKFTSSPLALYTPGSSAQPIFSSMAAVSVGTQEYLFVGTGSDLLPSIGVSVQYQLLGILDQGSSGTKTFQIDLAKTDGSGDDEKVSSFPAVAGDIVFFTTTAFKPTTPCSQPDAALYALTFIGGAAYDSTGDNKVSKNESPKVRTLSGAGRATAPFIVDQHLAFAAGGTIELFGDPADFNNGVGDVGVRILSWRDIR
jgi:hypothetical protein